MIPKYFDIHSHLNFADFDKDREEVIKRTLDNGVWAIVVGTDFESSKKAIEIAEKYDGIFASVGLHPTDTGNEIFDIEKYRKLALHPKVVAIGECGLEFAKFAKDSPWLIRQGESLAVDFKRQKELFIKHIELSKESNKPLIIHCREAYDEMIGILTDFYSLLSVFYPGNMHFFSGNWEQAKKFLDLGFTFSFAGPITFPPSSRLQRGFGRAGAGDYDEVIRNASLDKIMAETDCPFAAPVPHRGKRNEPLYVKEVVKKIAEIKGISESEAAEATTSNALRFFKIS